MENNQVRLTKVTSRRCTNFLYGFPLTESVFEKLFYGLKDENTFLILFKNLLISFRPGNGDGPLEPKT